MIRLDEDGNYIEQLIDLDFKTEFEVISSNPDTTAPEIKYFEVSEDIFDVADGDKTFNLKANLTDDLSGFISDSRRSDIQLYWYSPSGSQYVYASMGAYMYGRTDHPEWEDIIINVDDNNISFENIEVTIPQYSEPGTWTLREITANDAIGNNLYIERDYDGNYVTEGVDENGDYIQKSIDLDFKTEFEVISSNPDTTAPEFKNLEVSEDIFDVTNEDKTFDLSADLTDDISGFIGDSSRSYINLSWRSPSGSHNVYAYMGAYMYEYLDQDPEWQDIIIDVDNNNISFENIEHMTGKGLSQGAPDISSLCSNSEECPWGLLANAYRQHANITAGRSSRIRAGIVCRIQGIQERRQRNPDGHPRRGFSKHGHQEVWIG